MMCDLCFEGNWKWKLHFLQVICFFLAAASPPTGLGYFLGDTKAVLNGCEDHWTLQSNTSMLWLSQMTVCVDIRVVVPGAWVAFSYGSAYAPNPDLGMEGDTQAIYVWLLQVRHRFPAQMSPIHWHRVNGTMVAERTVIAHAMAIFPSGSLWLGCRHKNQLPGVEMGKVELYLFRMWADLWVHEACEEGTVISWNSQYWAVTSSKAKETDPYLLCGLGPGNNHLLSPAVTTIPPSNTSSTNQVSTSTSMHPITVKQSTPGGLFTSETPLWNCDISQLCSKQNAYYWMLLSVEGEKSSQTKQEVHNLVSKVFACNSDTNNAAHEVMSFNDFCQADGQLQVVEVSCRGNNGVNLSQTTCSVLLLLSHAVSVCDLQSVGETALQQAAGSMRARIITNVERVGRNLCEDVSPSKGSFVRCTSTSSLDDICQLNRTSEVTCSLFEPNSEPVPQLRTNVCPRPAPRFCDCTAFCDTPSQFYTIRIKITSETDHIDSIKNLLLKPFLCLQQSECSNYWEISNYYKGAHLECHGTKKRLYNCMVILEMSGPIDVCSFKTYVQQIIGKTDFITSDSPLTRMMVCGPPGLSVGSLLASNLTWVDSDQLPADICQPDSVLFECKANETFAVLLADNCSPKPQTSRPTQATTETNSVTAAPKSSLPSATYTTEDPHLNVTLTHSTSTQSETEQPVLQTSSDHLDGTVPNKTTETLSENTSTSPPNNSTLHSITTATNNLNIQNNATVFKNSKTTLSPRHTTAFSMTTAEAITIPNDTKVNNVTTPSVFTTNETAKYSVSTVTLSPNHTIYNVTAVATNDTASTNNYKTVYDVTMENSATMITNSAVTSNTRSNSPTLTPNYTYKQNVTSQNINHTKVYHVMKDKSDHMTGSPAIDSSSTSLYTALVLIKNYNMTTFDHKYTTLYNTTTPSNNYTSGYNSTTPNNNNTAVYEKQISSNNFTTANDSATSSNTYTAIYNVTSPSNILTLSYNATTPNDSYRTTHKATTLSNIYTTTNNATTSKNHTTVYNATTPSSIPTATFNAITPSNIYSNTFNATTPSSIHTTTYNTTTPSNFHTTTYNTTTPSNINTTKYNATTPNHIHLNTYNDTTASDLYSNTHNATTSSNFYSNTYNATTPSNFHTTTYNATTPSDMHAAIFNATKPGNIHSNTYNVTTSSSNYRTTYNAAQTSNNHTTAMFNATTSMNVYTTTDNATTPSNNYRTTHNATTFNNIHMTTSNGTIPSNIHSNTFNATTPSSIHTTTYNDKTPSNINTTYNATTPSHIHLNTYNTTRSSDLHANTHNATTPSNFYSNTYNATTPSNFHTTTYNATTPSDMHAAIFNATKSGNIHSNTYNATTTSNNYTTAMFNASTPMNIYTTTNNTTTLSNNYRTTHNATTLNNIHMTTSNATIQSNIHSNTFNVTTPSNIHTTTYNATTPSHIHLNTYNATTASDLYSGTHNATTPSNLYSNTYNATTPSDMHAAIFNATESGNIHSNTYNATTTSNNYRTTYNAALTSNNHTTAMFNATTPMDDYTTTYNATTPSKNDRTMYNGTIPSDIHTTTSNVTTLNYIYSALFNATAHNKNDTAAYNVTTSINIYQSMNSATTLNEKHATYNATTIRNIYTTIYPTTMPTNNYSAENPSSNQTTTYNSTSHSNIYTNSYNTTTTSNFYRAMFNVTATTNSYTAGYNLSKPSNNYTTVDNATTPTNSYSATYNAIPPNSNQTTAHNPTTPSNDYTNAYNATTPTTNYRTTNNATTSNNIYPLENNATTPSNIHTTLYNATTPSNIHTTANTTTRPSSSYTTVNDTLTESINFTAMNKVTTPNNTYTTVNNTTTLSNIYTTVYNVTTSSNNYTAVYNETTPMKNYISGFNATTHSSKYTKVHNATAVVSNYTTLHNATTPTTFITNHTATYSSATPSNNYTAMYNGLDNFTTVYSAATRSNNYTTPMTISPTTISHNQTTAFKTTTVPIREPQQITTAVSTNTTLIFPATNASETTYMEDSTMEIVTSLGDATTKPTEASLNNHTANYATVSVTGMTTDTKNSLAASSIQTTKAQSNLTTRANASVVFTTIATTTTTTHNPADKKSTTADISLTSHTSTLQTTILTTTIATISSTETTSAATGETTTSKKDEEEQANELLNQTQNTSQLNSTQVSNLVDDLEKLLDGSSVSQSVGQKIIKIISNLMNGDPSVLSRLANRLIRLVDILGLKLKVTGDRVILSSASLVLAVRTVDGTNFPTTSVDILNTDNVQLHALSRSWLKRSGSTMGSVYLPSSLTAGLLPEEQKWASRVQFTFYTKNSLFKDAAIDNQTVVSPVLGSSVANLSINNLKENIKFMIKNNNPVQASNTSCVFWDFTLNRGRGGWRSDGCFVVNATPEYTSCSCNHLTSFAILLDLSRQGITDHKQAQILTFITYIGCGISCVFLAFTLLTYLLFEKLLRDIPAKILVQLCLSILLLNLIFLLDGWLSTYSAVGLCISTAFFLHYFLLTTFTWAGLEALHMYLSIVRVFTPYLSRYMLKFSLMGWGIPLIVVIIVIAVDKDNYGLVTYGKYTDGTTDDFCWLRNDIAFYVGVVAYFLLIFGLCLLVFIVVMVQLNRIKKQNPHNQSPKRGLITDMRSIIGLVILLGLTWGFALFAWGDLYLPFVYLFSIFNSLHGFFVFVFHCAVKENVRRQWRTYLCCGKLRLAKNSDWSRMATQNKNSSAATVTTVDPHFIFHNSSVVSTPTNSNSSVFWDNGISDHSNSDVILNEIHRQNLSWQGEA